MEIDDSAEVERRTTAWIEGWRTSSEQPFSIDTVANLYDQGSDLTSFDFVGPAEGLTGWATCAREYQAFMSGVASWALTAAAPPRVTVVGEVAWSTVSVRGAGTLANGQRVAFDGRATLIWRRRSGAWRIVHEHASAPIPA